MLTVDRARKVFGDVVAVENVTFSVPPNSIFGLLGPNGAGKTTTMRMILGILLPDEGAIEWNGGVVDGRTRRIFGYLPEERGIYGKMRVREQIVFFAKLHGLREPDLSARVDHWIERLELGEYAMRPCSQLSKGNQQKVQIACAAVHTPQLLVLDEPFSGLDPVNADILITLLRELRRDGMTLILSSHQMWQLESLCEQFCIIAHGSNCANGTLSDLRAQWPTRIVRVEPAVAPLRDVLARVPEAIDVSTDAKALNFRVPASTDFASLARELIAAGPLVTFEAVEPTLHEIYLRAIGEGA